MILIYILFFLVFAIFIHAYIKNKIILKISFRNIFRKKRESFLIILACMTGIAFILGAFGINDTFNNYIKVSMENLYGEIDNIIYSRDKMVSEDFSTLIEDLYDKEIIDGHLPIYYGTISITRKDGLKKLDYSEINTVSTFWADYELMENFGQAPLKIPDSYKNIQDNQVVISKDVAKSMNLKIGDQIEIFIDFNFVSILFPKRYEVVDIIEEKGLLNYRGRRGDGARGNIFFNEEQTLLLLDQSKGYYDEVLISNTGDSIQGIDLNSDLREIFKNYDNIKIDYVKENEMNMMSSGEITLIFLALSFFAIVAGIILIVNVYGMLVEERKSELGVLRAIGLKRRHIRSIIFYESVFYTIFSVPFGIITGTIISRFTFINVETFFRTMMEMLFSYSDTSQNYFNLELKSYLISISLGFFIPIIISYFYTFKASKLDIIEAIKDIKMEKPAPKFKLAYILFIICIFLFLFNPIFYLKILFAAFAIYILPYCFKKANSIIRNLSALLPLLMVLLINDKSFGFLGVKSFIILISFIFIVLYNLKIIEFLLLDVIKMKGKKASVIKMSIAYPIRKPDRTGLVVSLYSILIFLIVVITVVSSIQTKRINNMEESLLLGYDGIYMDVMTDFTSKEVDIDYIENFELFEKRGELYYVIGETENTHFPVIFADDNFYEGAKIIFDKNSTIKNSEELKKNSEALLIPYIFTNEPFSLKLGDKIDFDFRSAIFNMSNLEAFEESEKNFFINREVKITSMLSKEIDTIFALPILSTGEDIELIKKNGFKINYFKLKDYEQKDSVKDFFINQGILFTFADDVIKFINVTIKGVVNIANSFLYFGIIVGILGIAITMFKSVQERTRIIGMLKAIGFNKRMIFQSFLIESSILILLGIISGTASGIFAGYQIYLNYFAGSSVEFFVPWSSLFLIIASFYVVSVVFVFIPSRLASKIPASQAMRNFE